MSLPDVERAGTRVLEGVGEPFSHHEIRGALDGSRQRTIVKMQVEPGGDRHSITQVLRGGRQPSSINSVGITAWTSWRSSAAAASIPARSDVAASRVVPEAGFRMSATEP
jgi:hypothetical protein